jgi:hypothetical protein
VPKIAVLGDFEGHTNSQNKSINERSDTTKNDLCRGLFVTIFPARQLAQDSARMCGAILAARQIIETTHF